MNAKARYFLGVGVVVVSTITASAQIFRPEAVSGAVLGGLAGAVIGNNSGDLGNEAWRGAAIGAVAGGLLGNAVGAGRESDAWRDTQVPVPSRSVYRRDVVAYRPYRPDDHWSGYDRHRVSRRPDPRVSGALLGGLAGAIIGHNDGRHGWEGAAYGAGAGLILGSIWDRADRRRDREASRVVYYEDAPREAARVITSVAPAAPQTVTINNYYYGPVSGTSVAGGANSLFGR